MAQYCRYCSELVTGNGIYCQAKNKELSEEYTKRVNRCSQFDFLSLDAYSDRTYQPRRKRKEKAQLKQISIEEVCRY